MDEELHADNHFLYVYQKLKPYIVLLCSCKLGKSKVKSPIFETHK